MPLAVTFSFVLLSTLLLLMPLLLLPAAWLG